MQPCLNSPKFPVLYILFVHLIFIYSIFVPHWASTVIGSCLIYFTQQEYKTFFGKCSGGVMVSVLASSALDRGFKYRSVKPKTVKLVFVASPISTQN